MSTCGCQSTPCTCEIPAECETPTATRCDLYVPGTENVWVERGCSPNDASAPGICLLDTMCDEQIIHVLERDDKARSDLLKVTSDQGLINLAKTVPKLPTVEQSDVEQALLNQPHNSGSIPFYALFRGKPPFAQ